MAFGFRPPVGGFVPSSAPLGLQAPGGLGGPPPPRAFVEEDRSHDWTCSRCLTRNFAKRQECLKCFAPRSQAQVPLVPAKAPPPVGMTLNGMVKSYNKKGFGYLMCSEWDLQDVYFLRENVSSRLLHPDMPGEQVTFEIFYDGRKPHAKNIRPLGEDKHAASGAHVFPAAQNVQSKAPRPFGRGFDDEDRSRDWACPRCGARNFMKRLECFKCRTPKPFVEGDDSAPSSRRDVSPHAGSRAQFMAQGGKGGYRSSARAVSPHAGSRAQFLAQGGKINRPKSKSSSGSESESRSKKKKKKKDKKKKKRKKSSSSDSSSSKAKKKSKQGSASSGEAEQGATVTSTAGSGNPEVDAAKAKALEELVRLRSVQPKETRLSEFRALLRKWHPDKNPDNIEVATAVFQFLQKGKPMLDADEKS